MTLDPTTEPPIDTTLAHYMEQRALEVALEKAQGPHEHAKLERLIALGETLNQHRAAYLAEATAKRHARGEVYSSARVATINAMGPSKDKMDELVRGLYLKQATADDVLRAHARTHFGRGLMFKRSVLSATTPDIAASARENQLREEAFAAAWLDTIGDPAFTADLRRLQREALLQLRTSARPMLFVATPPFDAFDDADAQTLGKVWNKLDDLASSLGVEPLSSFIALPDEGESGDVDPARLLPTLTALVAAIQAPGEKFPNKRAALAPLTKLCASATRLAEQGGRAHFEVDL